VLAIGTAWESDPRRYGFDIGEPERLYHKMMSLHVDSWVPTSMWPSLPGYRLNGKGFAELAQETAAFAARLERAGISTQIHDQVFLMARLAGMSPAGFKRQTSKCIADGDFDRLESFASLINKNIRARAASAFSEGSGCSCLRQSSAITSG